MRTSKLTRLPFLAAGLLFSVVAVLLPVAVEGHSPFAGGGQPPVTTSPSPLQECC
jgi:hypothetical protein